ncbi:MAG: radical SAM protein [Candidatus Hodarchaeales archaeon]
MSDSKLYSFSSANTFPMKILLNPEIIKDANFYKQLPCLHFQVNPTNLCNFKCEFCSCSDRNKNLFLSKKQLKDLFYYGEKVGMKSMTITGGGEPTIYRHWDKFMEYLWKYKIDAGLVTNGTLLNKVKHLDYMTWIRISASDFLRQNLKAVGLTLGKFLERIETTVQCNHNVDAVC